MDSTAQPKTTCMCHADVNASDTVLTQCMCFELRLALRRRLEVKELTERVRNLTADLPQLFAASDAWLAAKRATDQRLDIAAPEDKVDSPQRVSDNSNLQYILPPKDTHNRGQSHVTATASQSDRANPEAPIASDSSSLSDPCDEGDVDAGWSDLEPTSNTRKSKSTSDGRTSKAMSERAAGKRRAVEISPLKSVAVKKGSRDMLKEESSAKSSLAQRQTNSRQELRDEPDPVATVGDSANTGTSLGSPKKPRPRQTLTTRGTSRTSTGSRSATNSSTSRRSRRGTVTTSQSETTRETVTVSIKDARSGNPSIPLPKLSSSYKCRYSDGTMRRSKVTRHGIVISVYRRKTVKSSLPSACTTCSLER